MSNSISRRFERLSNEREIEPVRNRTMPKRQKRVMLLDSYCKKQKGLCISCGQHMVKPMLKKDNNSFYLGACCSKDECAVSHDIKQKDWFDSSS